MSINDFELVLDRASGLRAKKLHDYASEEDPYSNFRGVEALGIPAWIGITIRMQDKMARIQQAAKQYVVGGEFSMANESLEDSFMDLLVYAGLALCVLNQAEEAANEEE